MTLASERLYTTSDRYRLVYPQGHIVGWRAMPSLSKRCHSTDCARIYSKLIIEVGVESIKQDRSDNEVTNDRPS